MMVNSIVPRVSRFSVFWTTFSARLRKFVSHNSPDPRWPLDILIGDVNDNWSTQSQISNDLIVSQYVIDAPSVRKDDRTQRLKSTTTVDRMVSVKESETSSSSKKKRSGSVNRRTKTAHT
jgi:hypothetical protein